MRVGLRVALLAVAALVVAVACGRTSWDSRDVRVTSIEAQRTLLRPGLYGVPVRVRLYNHGDEVEGLRVALSFRDSAGVRTDFDHREIAPLFDGRIAMHGTAEIFFEIDVLTTATSRELALEAMLVHGSAGEPYAPFQSAVALSMLPVRDLIVNTMGDAVTSSGGRLTLREALLVAAEEPNVDRILFDPAVFPPDALTAIPLAGPLPAVLSTAIVDASAAGVVLEPSAAWPVGNGYAMQIHGAGTVRGLTFREFGSRYAPSGDPNCGQPGNGVSASGSIVVTSGADVAIVENVFSDASSLAATRCLAAPIRVYGGPASGFATRRVRVLRNDLLYLPWYAIQVAGISEHAVVAENRVRGLQRGAATVLHDNAAHVTLEANVISDGPVQGAYLARNASAEVLNNVFARLAPGANETVFFETDMPVALVNNVYQSNGGASAIRFLVSGAGGYVSHETASSKAIVMGGGAATIDTSGLLSGIRLGVVIPSAGSLGYTVLDGSPLIDSGADAADRNGPAPGRWNRHGPDRGANELD